MFFFFKQKTAYELRISDWSSDVCSSDLVGMCALRSALTLGAATVYAVDPVQTRRDRAQAAGAVPVSPPAVNTIREATGGLGVDAVIDAVGRSEERRVGNECGSTCRSRWWPYY